MYHMSYMHYVGVIQQKYLRISQVINIERK